jgi:hypothetical protein
MAQEAALNRLPFRVTDEDVTFSLTRFGPEFRMNGREPELKPRGTTRRNRKTSGARRAET